MMASGADTIRGMDSLELELERNDEAPSLARAAIAGFCQHRGLPPGTIVTVMLLVSELVTNAVVHPMVQPAGVIALRGRLGPTAVRIEVTDPGTGFHPEPRDPTRATGGYGLYLVDKEAARWGVEQTPHTTVWFEVNSKPN